MPRSMGRPNGPRCSSSCASCGTGKGKGEISKSKPEVRIRENVALQCQTISNLETLTSSRCIFVMTRTWRCLRRPYQYAEAALVGGVATSIAGIAAAPLDAARALVVRQAAGDLEESKKYAGKYGGSHTCNLTYVSE